ncbi:MAG: PKD domain-containing protein, partial [Chitinophagales bacterium]|nr:PKD domain-containing protein [Chitinophagales bacterium]
ALAYSPWTISYPAPSTLNPLNAIYGPWHDVDPSVPPFGTVAFGTFGTAPNRFFVYNFCSVPMFQCNDTLFTGQIILFEGTNIIETNIGEKRLCPTWNSQAAIHGLQDSTGTVAVIVPGRNFPEVWTAFNEGTRFTPNGNSYDITSVPYAPVPFAVGGLVWKDENGLEVGSGFDVTVNPDSTTQYIATLASCGFSSDTLTITVGSVAAELFATNISCASSNDGSVLADPVGNFPPYNYVWIDASGDTLQVNSSSSSDSLINITSGTYLVTITDSGGCVSSYNITVGSNPFNAAFTISPALICFNDEVSFTNNSEGDNLSYNWLFGDGTSSDLENASHIYDAPGTYEVQLVISGQAGCIDTVTQQLQVYPNILPGFSVSDAPYCVGNEISFTDVSVGNAGLWEWDFGDGTTSTVQNPTHTYSVPDTFLVHLTVTDNFCGQGEFSTFIVVNTIPTPQLREDTILCTNEPLILSANAAGTSYLWSTGDTSPTISVPAPEETTNYSVIVDNYGCIGTDSVLISIDCVFGLPSAFSPNGDGKNDLLHPLGSLLSDYQMIIYNRWGQEVYNRRTNNLLEGWDGQLNGEPQEMGVYVFIINATFVSGESFSKTGNITLVR